MDVAGVLSVLISATLSSLYEESSRVKLAKGLFLTGVTFILLDLLSPLLANELLYIALPIIALLLALCGVYSMDKFSEFINEALLDTYICLFTGENCEGIVEANENLIETLFRKIPELIIGKWTPLERMLEEIRKSKSPKALLALFAHIISYQLFIPLSLILLLTVLLEVSGITNIMRTMVRLPLYGFGAILVVLASTISITTKPAEYEDKAQKEPSRQQMLQPLPADVYKKVLKALPKNRWEEALLKVLTALSTINPNYLKPKINLPLATPVNLYECSSALSSIVDDLEKLGEHGYEVERLGDPVELVKCDNVGSVSKFVELYSKISPIDVYRKIVLLDKDELEGRGLKLLIKEVKNNPKKEAGVKRKNERRKLYLDTGVERKHSRTIAVVVIKAWRGCTKYWRIKSSGESSGRKREESPARVQIFPRRIFSVLIVGRRDIGSLINIMLTAYLKPASIENTLCMDEEEDVGKK